MINGNQCPSDGIKGVLGFEGLNLPSETCRIYEQLFWKALSEGSFVLEGALDEVLAQLGVADEERDRLKQIFDINSFARSGRLQIIRH